jgi:o-succinylbenzoate synthase
VVIEGARLLSYRLPLRRPWVTARGVLCERAGWLVRVDAGAGGVGLGDCAPLPGPESGSPDPSGAWLTSALGPLRGLAPREALAGLPPPGSVPGAARSALECALLDLAAREAGLPLARFLSADAARAVPVNAALGRLGPGTLVRVRGALRAGFRVLKLKVGVGPVALEVALLRRVAAGLPPGVRLRLDANGAWSEPEALAGLEGMVGLPIDALEEPLRRPTAGALARLQRAARFPLAADESLAGGAGRVERLLRRRAVRRLVLKPALCGGLLPALALARRAEAAGVEAVVTTTLDSAVGTLAALHLAAALPRGSGLLAHGLATSEWLARDLAEPPAVAHGRMTVPDAPGLGLTGLADPVAYDRVSSARR